MSKQVRSNGQVQRKLIMAATDELVDVNEFVSYVTRKNLNQVDLKTLESIKTLIKERWWKTGKLDEALSLIDEFITIRKRQSAKFRAKEDRDYSILKG